MTTSQAEKRIRRWIWIQVALIMTLGAAPSWLIAKLFIARQGMPFPLAVALGTLFLLSFWIGLLLVVLFVSRIVGGIRMRRIQSIEPAIRRMLAAHAGGRDLSTQLRAAYDKQPSVTEEILTQVLSQIVGSSNVRLLQLARNLGMVDQLVKRYRSRRASVRRCAIGCLALFDDELARNVLLRALKDRDGRIRTDVSRSLIRLAGQAEIESVFEFMVTQPLLIRALLADSLRPHALALCESCLPRALSSGEPRRILSALEVLRAWQVILPLPSFPAVLRSEDPAVRSAAFRVLSYVAMPADAGALVVGGLRDSDASVRVAAAIAAGRLRVYSAIPLLADIVHRETGNPALASVYALSELGESGLAILEEMMTDGDPDVSAVALEALERARIGRHDYART
jgi:HEAT repeat protein